MKKKFNSMFLAALVLIMTFVMIGCASGPELGKPTELQQLLNELPAIKVAGNDLKFQFGGDSWIAKKDGKNFLAGTFKSQDSADGSNITLKQTHIYSTEKKPGIGGDIGWVDTPGPDISLEYKKGPPASLNTK